MSFSLTYSRWSLWFLHLSQKDKLSFPILSPPQMMWYYPVSRGYTIYRALHGPQNEAPPDAYSIPPEVQDAGVTKEILVEMGLPESVSVVEQEHRRREKCIQEFRVAPTPPVLEQIIVHEQPHSSRVHT